LSKFYLNGKIIDRYRHTFTGRATITNLREVNKDVNYFSKYEGVLWSSLKRTDNVLFAMFKHSIFNPFGHYTYSAGRGVCLNWEWIDFFKFDINELFNGYDYMVLLPGWWKIKEAWLKLLVAKGIGVKIITLKKLLKELS